MRFSFLFYFFLISLFPCMQSRFIQIKYCSNILIIPELLYVVFFRRLASLAVLLAALLPFRVCGRMFCFCRVLLDLWVTILACLVYCVASLNGFIYKFVIHYSWNQKRPSRCKQIRLPQVSGFKDHEKQKMVNWFRRSWCFPVGMFLLISRPLHWI